MNTEEFITKAKLVHGDKYDYSKVNFINWKNKVTIICKLHGEFPQNPHKHLTGNGCKKCSYLVKSENYRFTTEEFIAKAKLVHGDKYDYSKVNYIDSNSKVILICPIHGEFRQSANDHLRGRGCCSCGIESMRKKLLMSQEQFIQLASSKHNNFYDYSKVNFNGVNYKVTIICPIHGEFQQIAWNHLNGKVGCSLCAFKLISKSNLITQEEFISKCNKIHNNFYDYSKTIYTGINNKIIIECPKHGEFTQVASAHSRGKGCPHCNSSRSENRIRNFLVENKIDFTPQKTFDDCVGKKRKLPFDFYLPQHNLCIEYQGIQHYEVVEYWGGADKFLMIQETDSIKKNYCTKNGIGYLAIPYTEDPIQVLSSTLGIGTESCPSATHSPHKPNDESH
jgi:hypothetical protein